MSAVKKRLRVGVLFGGRSGEHEVSLNSAASVIAALDPGRYDVVPIGITKDGQWMAGSSAQNLLPEVLLGGRRVMLGPDPNLAALVPFDIEQPEPVEVDVVFPVLHGTYGEDGTVQGLLELADLPYVGSGVIGSAVGMDKDMQKRLFLQAKLPVADFLAVSRGRWEREPLAVRREIEKKFRYPVFVKPATLGSSVGMTKAHDRAELEQALTFAAEFAQKLVIERTIRGREIELSVLGNEQARASIPGEIVPHREFYDYEAKYLEEGTRLIIPAKLSKPQVKRFQELAVRAFHAVEALGLSRVDFFLERGTNRIYLNEINTIPGFTSISMYPKLWEASGLSYRALLDELIELALAQHREKQRTKYTIELSADSLPSASSAKTLEK
jgi:D-alanine-D-alanine ligase